mgnify:CR=1 FL=1
MDAQEIILCTYAIQNETYCANFIYVIIKQRIALFWIDITLFPNLTQFPSSQDGRSDVLIYSKIAQKTLKFDNVECLKN